jgi:hypothetical protein
MRSMSEPESPSDRFSGDRYDEIVPSVASRHWMSFIPGLAGVCLAPLAAKLRKIKTIPTVARKRLCGSLPSNRIWEDVAR